MEEIRVLDIIGMFQNLSERCPGGASHKGWPHGPMVAHMGSRPAPHHPRGPPPPRGPRKQGRRGWPVPLLPLSFREGG
jgi:hypothetical protein